MWDRIGWWRIKEKKVNEKNQKFGGFKGKTFMSFHCPTLQRN